MSFSFKDLFKKDPNEWGKDVGKEIATGIGVGIDDGSIEAITSTDKVYVEVENLTKNAAKNAQRIAQKQQKRKLANLKNALNLELVSEQEYYEKLKAFRDTNLREGSDAWYKCTEEIAKYNKKLRDEIEKQAAELEEQLKKQAEKVIEMRDKLAEKLKSDEPWIEKSKVTFKGMGKNGTDLIYSSTELKNFDEELKQLELYRKLVKDLQKLGDVPLGMFEDIGKLSVEDGLKTVRMILSADNDARKKFFSGYNAREDLAIDTANDFLQLFNSGELEKAGIGNIVGLERDGNALNQSLNFAEILKNNYSDVPESYYALGEQSGTAFGEGLLSQIPETMEQVKNCFASAVNDLATDLMICFKKTIEGGANLVNNNYQSTYNFNSSRDTTTQQLNTARNAETLKRMRGGG